MRTCEDYLMEQLYFIAENYNSKFADFGLKYLARFKTYKAAYKYIQDIVGDSDYVTTVEDRFVSSKRPKGIQRAESNGELESYYEMLFTRGFKESDYKELIENWFTIKPTQLDLDEEYLRLLRNKGKVNNAFWGSGLDEIATYLESLSKKDALGVVLFYYLSFGANYEDQLITDIRSDLDNGYKFSYVQRVEFP